jgi:GT2 family glycosyltransferase
LNRPVYLAFATGPQAATAEFLHRVAAANPDCDLLVVARRRPPKASPFEWTHVAPGDTTRAILAACRKAIGSLELRGAAIHSTRRGAEWRLRAVALRLAGRELRLYNDNLDHFRVGDFPTLWRHLKWRWRQRPKGVLWWKLLAKLAILCVRKGGGQTSPTGHPEPQTSLIPGITLVIPTRDGRDLLDAMLPSVCADLDPLASEIIVVDNGSSDQTAAFLATRYPRIRVELSSAPLSFSEAVNRGIGAARYSHVVLLNNDMQIEPGFFSALIRAFDRTPGLFCATAQIFFPEGQRREETGLCFWRRDPGEDFPVYCAEPEPGEDGTLVLYGSGGCSMYDTTKLRALGGFDEVYRPAYVEDLDIGYRAWQQGWPTVFCAGAKVEHRHRTTTSRYYQPEYLDYLVERNYLRFLVRATGDAFPELWQQAIARLQRRAANGDAAARKALGSAWREAMARKPHPPSPDEQPLNRSLTR